MLDADTVNISVYSFLQILFKRRTLRIKLNTKETEWDQPDHQIQPKSEQKWKRQKDKITGQIRL